MHRNRGKTAALTVQKKKKSRTDPNRSSLAGIGGDYVCACEGMHSDPLAYCFSRLSLSLSLSLTHTYKLKRKPSPLKFKHIRINKNSPHRFQPGALKHSVCSFLFQYGSKCPEEEQPAKEGFRIRKCTIQPARRDCLHTWAGSSATIPKDQNQTRRTTVGLVFKKT